MSTCRRGLGISTSVQQFLLPSFLYIMCACTLAEAVCGFPKYGVYIILTMTMFVTSQSYISLPSFMFVSAAVSEIHDLNQNKKEKKFENGNFQFTTFPRHIPGN